MAGWDKVPRDFLTVVRVIAIIGGLRVAVMAYEGFVIAEPPTPAEIAARTEQGRVLADQGEAGLTASYVAKVDLVTKAAERCADTPADEREHSGDCKFARLWIDRYQQRTDAVLASPSAFEPKVREAAARYQSATERVVGNSGPPA